MKPKTKIITVRGIKCPRCWDHIWSRSGHDFRWCFCGYCFVDGGRSYLRYGYGENGAEPGTQEKPEEVDLEVEVTVKRPMSAWEYAMTDYLIHRELTK